MNNEPSTEDVNKFLARVIEIEEKYSFVNKGQDTARKEELRALLEDFCK